MSLGTATRAIIDALLKAKDFCLPEKEVREVLKRLGYSDSSTYVYIYRLSKKGVVTKKKIDNTNQICLDIEKLRDLGIAVILLA